MKKLFGEHTSRVAGIALFIAAGLFLILTLRILLVPLVAALFVAYLFEPGVAALERRDVSRGSGFLLLLVGSVIVIAVLLVFAPAWLVPDPVVLSREALVDRVSLQLKQIEKWLVTEAPMLGSLRLADEITRRATEMGQKLFAELPGLLTAFTANLVLVPFMAFFFIRDGGRLKRRVVELVPNRYFETALILFYKIDDQIGGYLRGRLIECMLVGATQMMVMSVADFFVPQPQILVLSVVCGVTSLIPYVGPLFGAAFGLFLYLGSNATLASCLVFLGATIVSHLVDNFMIAPTVLSHNVDLHPLTVVLVLVIGGELLGVLGLLIAIPVAATVKVIAAEFYSNYRAQAR